jgi:hypothetical protein
VEVLFLIVAVAMALCLPVKCYTDAQFKMKCLEMHGNAGTKGEAVTCDLGVRQ